MRKLIGVFCLFTASTAFAWGPTGHRAVGEIASRFLSIETMSKVHQILDGQSLAKVSTWPDEIKSDPTNYSHTYNWHYTTWQSTAHTHSHEHENDESGYLLKSVKEQVEILKNSQATKAQKAFAIKFIVHLIGDAHMPFHVGNGNDRGGNYCKVTFHSKAFNLHALWDEGMIDFNGLSFTEFAKFIREGKTLSDIQKARQGEMLDWVKESKDILPSLYPEGAAEYCAQNAPAEKLPKLGYEYSYKFMPVIEQRIFEAGVRLALVLNDSLK